MPSSARALASGPASIARPDGDRARELEHERLRVGVVAADERVLLRRLLAAEVATRRASGGPRSRARRRSSWIRCAIEVASVVGNTPPLRERELRGDGEHGRRADRVAQLAGRLDRAVGLRREHDEVGAAGRILVRRAVDAELGARPRARARRHASRSRRRSRPRAGGRRARCRSCRCRRAGRSSRPRPPVRVQGASASRRAASRSVMSVSVTTSGTSASARRVGAVDDERVEQTRRNTAPRCAGVVPPAMRCSIRSSGPLTARPPISGLTATARTAGCSSAARMPGTARIGWIET